MNLSDIIHEVWKDKRVKDLGIRKDEARIIVKVVIDKMREGFLKYGKLKIENLFTLEIRKAKGRKIENPSTKEPMYIEDYYKVGIIPSKKIKDGLKEKK